MRALLGRWAKAEPERCALIEGVITLKFARTILVPDDFPLDKLDQAKLLAAVIEAIEARGWDWALTSTAVRATKERKYLVTVAYVSQSSDTATAALLSAYLKAVEALS